MSTCFWSCPSVHLSHNDGLLIVAMGVLDLTLSNVLKQIVGPQLMMMLLLLLLFLFFEVVTVVAFVSANKKVYLVSFKPGRIY